MVDIVDGIRLMIRESGYYWVQTHIYGHRKIEIAEYTPPEKHIVMGFWLVFGIDGNIPDNLIEVERVLSPRIEPPLHLLQLA